MSRSPFDLNLGRGNRSCLLCQISFMANFEVPLLQQHSANNDPYRDPLAVLDWRGLALDRYGLPPGVMSLYGLAYFAALLVSRR
jgi:hypothetical protein